MKATIELGKVKVHGLAQPVKIAKNAVNKHILVTGMSGSGKTVALQQIEKNAIESGACVVVLNCGATHEWNRGGDDRVVHCVVRDEGFPFRLLVPIKGPDEKVECVEDISENIIASLDRLNRMSRVQKKVLRQAICAVLERSGSVSSMKEIAQEMEREESEDALEALETFSIFFQRIQWIGQTLELQPGKIYNLDFSGYDSLTQWLLAEMALSWLWRYAQLCGKSNRYDTYVVCDEFQNLDSDSGPVLSQILREGRRHKLFLVLATQTLVGVERCERVILHQVGTNLFFKPTEEEYRQIARLIDAENVEQIVGALQKLCVGECIAKGRFSVGRVILEKPLKVSFK